jgi:ferredoxin-NADP reductase/ferredoxin
MKHAIELLTPDGHTLAFDCGEEEDVLAAAARNGITLPSICREGSCGACRARCSEGAWQLGSHNPASLSKDAAERGEVLLCRTYPRTPLRIEVEQNRAAIAAGPAPERMATVVALDRIASDVVRLEVQLEPDAQGNGGATFDPGQYAELAPPDRAFARAYSIANTPNWDGRLEFYIRLQAGGRFSEFLCDAESGTQLRVRGPSGSFRLDESSLNERWFVAGGTGLAPVLSMLRWSAESGDARPMRLFFGVNDEAQLFALDVLEQLTAALPGLQVELCLWRPGNGWHGWAGTPADALADRLRSALAQGIHPDIYVCGPPALIEAVDRLAGAAGLQSPVRAERFLPTTGDGERTAPCTCACDRAVGE